MKKSLNILGAAVLMAAAHLYMPQTAAGAEIYPVLGRPTGNSVDLKVAGTESCEVQVLSGEMPSAFQVSSEVLLCSRDNPADIRLTELQPDTEYAYSIRFRPAGEQEWNTTGPYSFHTARSSGSTFSFAVQSDSHFRDKADRGIYREVMEGIAGMEPDFLFDLGDTFLNDDDTSIDFEAVNGIYFEHLPYLSRAAADTPLFLVLGNHEGEYGYLMNEIPDNLPVYSTLSRKQYFPNPRPDRFYSGNEESETFCGQPENYYSFTWGDALFIALDPYRYTLQDPLLTEDRWGWTLGDTQYRWFTETLEKSTARFKFVFAHHLNGNSRGGVAYADLYEWGGCEANGRRRFEDERPGWKAPVHQVMAENGVTIFFQGHDHLFAREEKDGVVYQTMPKPAELVPEHKSNETYYPNADLQLNSGFLSVEVAPDHVRVDYHRSVVAGQPENSDTGVVYSYLIDDTGALTVLKKTDDSAAFTAYRENAGKHGGAKSPDGAENTGGGAADAKKSVGGDTSVRREKQKSPRAGKRSASEFGPGESGSGASARSESAENKPADNESAGLLAAEIEPLQARPFLGPAGDTSIRIQTYFEENGEYYIEYGLDSASLDRRTETKTVGADTSYTDDITGLEPDTDWHYRLCFRSGGQAEWKKSEVYSFHTMRPKGVPFTFAIEADPHFDESSGDSVYRSVLANILGDDPDFLIDLGDVSMAEKLTSSAEEILYRYRLVRSYWDDIAHSVPFHMVLGNHDGEAGWNFGKNEGTGENASELRRKYLPGPSGQPPFPGAGDFIRSWEWGGALFVLLDPYSPQDTKPKDNWDWTLGREQYDWLARTLDESLCPLKFVFIHHLVGGLERNNRGGREAAALYEWGGNNPDGSPGFAQYRPGWEMPVHDLLKKHGVDAVFHGHDHFYAREEHDGIVYQLVPQPSFDRVQNMEKIPAEFGYFEGVFLSSPGYLRVTIDDGQATVEFVQGEEGKIADSYILE